MCKEGEATIGDLWNANSLDAIQSVAMALLHRARGLKRQPDRGRWFVSKLVKTLVSADRLADAFEGDSTRHFCQTCTCVPNLLCCSGTKTCVDV
ncbi:hypothetical protein HD806DRAFT_489530 [Xylariaceae sp. AK1471]|nr:hypothetical protein HD806DRAFT_489530 [Xylariaceae sp. AK1471]